MKTHHRACPRCAGDDPQPLPRYGDGQWQIVRCSGCGFTYVPEAPDYAELASNLAWEKTSKQEASRRDARTPHARKTVRRVRRLFRGLRSQQGEVMRRHLPAGAVLDIGCGDGTRVPEPFTPFGIEISQGLWATADAHMRGRGGYAVNAAALEGLDAFADNGFAGIVMRSFLEHEDRPREVLAAAFRKLKPGGVAFVRVPNFGSLNARILGPRWCGIRLPDHLNYFTSPQLQAMGRELGYGYRLLNPWTLPTDDNIKALLVKPA